MVQKYEIIWNLPNFAVTLFNFPSANLLRLGKKRNEFLLFCSRLFVTLRFASANLLRLGKKRNAFLLFCSRLFVTLRFASANLLRLGKKKK